MLDETTRVLKKPNHDGCSYEHERRRLFQSLDAAHSKLDELLERTAAQQVTIDAVKALPPKVGAIEADVTTLRRLVIGTFMSLIGVALGLVAALFK